MRIVPEAKRTVQVGMEFGRLTISGVQFYMRSTGWNASRRHVVCDCECGESTVVLCGSLFKKLSPTRSCGCIRSERIAEQGRKNSIQQIGRYRHGHSRAGKITKLYHVWQAMRDRCTKTGSISYKNYGARGISVCREWEDFVSFQEWAAQAGYQDGLSIERINNDGNYEPSNCRWATKIEQCNNTRVNRFIEAFGEQKTFANWLRDGRCLVGSQCLRYRLRVGIDPENAMTQPLKHRRAKSTNVP